jgi:hypothetical protein
MKALWRRLDRPGHDAAWLRSCGDGWTLSGAAVFSHEEGPACLAYCLEVDRGWVTKRGTIRGFVGDRAVDHDIRRDEDAWRLDGVAVEGLGRLMDLDLSFTPATNVLQLRRAAPPLGQRVALPAAWFNLDDATLSELPQIYERLSATTYRYEAPSVPYLGVLEIGASGFIKSYPSLWALED